MNTGMVEVERQGTNRRDGRTEQDCEQGKQHDCMHGDIHDCAVR